MFSLSMDASLRRRLGLWTRLQVDAGRGEYAHERLVVGLQREIGKNIDQLAVERFELHSLADDLLALADIALDRLIADADKDIDQHQEQDQDGQSGQKYFDFFSS